MRAIWQKIQADLLQRRVISALIICAIAVASSLLTLAISTLMNMGGPYERVFEQVNGAHLWLNFKPEMARLMNIRRIEALPGVAQGTGPQYSYTSLARIGETRVPVTLRVIPEQEPGVQRLYWLEGRGLLPGKREVIAEKYTSSNYNLSVGDKIILTGADGREVSMPVAGIAYDVMYDTYRGAQAPYVYISESSLRSLYPDKATWELSLGLRLVNPQAVDDMLAEIRAMNSLEIVATHTDWRDVRESAIFRGQLASIFLSAFSFFAILATVLIVISLVSSSVLAQIKQIGTLKAIGFSSAQVLLVYVGQYGVLSMIGSGLGLGLGLLLAPLPMQAITASLNTSFRPAFSLSLLALVFSIIPGVTVLAALGAAASGARVNIIKAMAVGAEAPSKKMFWGARLAERCGAPMVIVLGLNELFARPLRTGLAGLNLTLGVIGIVFGLALTETIQTYRENPALLGIVYEASVTRQKTTDNLTRSLLNKAPGVEAYYAELQLKAWSEDKKSFSVRAVEGDLADFPFQVTEGRFFQLKSNEALAGKGLLDWLGLKVGDALTVRLNEEDGPAVTWVISGVYPEPADAGQRLMVNLSSVERLVRNSEPTSYYLLFGAQADPAAIRSYLAPRKDSDLNLVTVQQAIPDAIIYLQAAVFMLAGILILIAMINIFISAMLNAQEKLRVIGILKTIGMTPGQIIQMFNISAGSLGVLAAGLGVPLGMLITRGMLGVLSNSFGFGRISTSLNAGQAAILVPLIVLMSMLGGYLPARWAANLFIVRVLRKD